LPTVLVAFLAFGAAFADQAQAAPPASSPTEMLKDRNGQITKILNKSISEAKQDAQIKKVVNKMLDFKLLTKSAFGKYWKDMEGEQQDEAVDLLKELIQRNYVKQIHDRKDGEYTVQYEDEEVDGKKAVVTTLVVAEQRHEEETQVVYKMVKSGARWKVRDIETDGVSLVRNYRTQFYKIIEKEENTEAGLERLLSKLRDKIESDSESVL
jgi:phospholipid transport system substrate-binding protein